MGAELETLFRLQDLDLGLLAKQQEIARHERLLAERRKSMDAVQANVDALSAKRKELVNLRALAERKVSDSHDLLKERRQRLSRVRTERELRAGEGEVASLSDEIGEQEEQQLLLMEQVEEIEKKISDARAELVALEQEDHRQIDEEAGRIEELKREVADEREARDIVASELDPTMRQRYEQILTKHSGRAVVEVVGGSCAGCYMHVPPQTVIEILKRGVVRVCPSCQRILYTSENKPAEA